jgi:hypothetical protein
LRAKLDVTEARVVVPYDALNLDAQSRYGCLTNPACPPDLVASWVATAHQIGLQPFLVLGPSEISPTPDVATYAAAFRLFAETFPTVHKWGAWNEPDLSPGTARRPQLAADYWLAAHRILAELGRSDHLVAGEFSAINKGSVQRGYFHQYKKAIERAGVKPLIWSFHDYGDILDRSTSRARLFLQATPSHTWVDLTEQGVLLNGHGHAGQNQLNGRPKLQRAAARTFLRLASLSPRILGVDYYQALPADGSWDTSLIDLKGRNRPAYCVLVRQPAAACKGSDLVR